MTKKLTVKDLLKNKDTFSKKKNVSLLIERLDSEITIEVPARSLVMEAIEMAQDPNISNKADSFLIYSIIKEPNLKDPILLKEYGVSEPSDIVEKIFEIGEIGEISSIAMELAGFRKGMVKVVEEVKN